MRTIQSVQELKNLGFLSDPRLCMEIVAALADKYPAELIETINSSYKSVELTSALVVPNWVNKVLTQVYLTPYNRVNFIKALRENCPSMDMGLHEGNKITKMFARHVPELGMPGGQTNEPLFLSTQEQEILELLVSSWKIIESERTTA